MRPADHEDLTQLGLTSLEADVYLALLQGRTGGATGYAVAKGIGKPTANTYKASAGLEEKGAVMLEDGERREYRPVPPGEFLGGLERRFAERVERVTGRLRAIPADEPDGRVYTLKTPEQVIERVREMLTVAQAVAILDLFPKPASALAADIVAAAERGVMVVVKIYEPLELPGVRVLLDPDAARVTMAWDGQWANAAVDGEQHVLALLGRDGETITQAVWSASPFLSYLYYSGLVSEIGIGLIEENLAAASGVSPVDAVELVRTLLGLAPGGMRLRTAKGPSDET